MVRFNPAPGVRKANAREHDAIACLIREHDVIRKLFREFEQLAEHGGTNEEKAETAGQICFLWSVHMQLEEELFYPAAKAVLGATAKQQHALDDHKGSRELVAMLDELEPGDTDFDATVAVLADYVLTHMAEEEADVFPELRQRGMEIDMLGRAIAFRRKVLIGDITRAAPSPPSAAPEHARS